MMSLKKQHCTPPEGRVPLSDTEEEQLVQQVNGWKLERDGPHEIHKEFRFEGFEQALTFLNHVADIAKVENHHPDLCISYNHVNVTLSTHKIGGLHPNDFIVAAKVDAVLSAN